MMNNGYSTTHYDTVQLSILAQQIRRGGIAMRKNPNNEKSKRNLPNDGHEEKVEGMKIIPGDKEPHGN
jgi:hypothetical protein